MLWTLIGTVLSWLGSGPLDSILGFLEKKSDNETQRARIKSLRDQHAMDVSASVVKTGMAHKIFWVAWGTAAIPLCTWFGYGILNTMFTSLPHIAEIPPGLLPWAQTAWSNIFYSGAGVLGTTALANSLIRK